MHGQETSILTAVIISSAIVFLIMAYFIITIIRGQRRNTKLYKEKLEIEIATLENERKRIASDLHDELGPLLSAVRLQIQCVNAPDKEDEKVLEKSAKHIDDILHRVRAIANNLMPSVLLRKGLVPAVREFTDAINSADKSLHIELKAEEDIQMETEKSVHVYRIIQEIVHNCIKHARADSLKLSLAVEQNKLKLDALDNGKGFDEEMVRKQGSGLGLSNLKSRVEMLNGYLFMKTKPGKGTQINIEVPN